jgi:hypothetical protein
MEIMLSGEESERKKAQYVGEVPMLVLLLYNAAGVSDGMIENWFETSYRSAVQCDETPEVSTTKRAKCNIITSQAEGLNPE